MFEKLKTLGTLIVLSGCAHQPVTDQNFGAFLQNFSGAYSNQAQVRAERGLAEDARNDSLKLFIERVSLPAFGEHVFYAEWQDAAMGDVLKRQRIYVAERVGDIVVMQLHIFPRDEEFVRRTAGAHLDHDRLDGVTPADMVPLPGCDIYLTFGAQGLSGAMKEGDCKVPPIEAEEEIYSWTQMRIGRAAFSYKDSWRYQVDGRVAYEISPNWYMFDKVSD